MPKQNKPSIVFAHGLWADGSCFQKLIPTLQAEGHEAMASQHGLDSLKSDVDCVTRCLGRVNGPVVLVGHSYGGTLITHAGTTGSLRSSTSRRLHPTRPKPRKASSRNSPHGRLFSHRSR
jgi:pimeloyl-ACP methyl ester carboxylesterase